MANSVVFCIGDPIKLLNSKEQGVIVRIVNNTHIIADIDGFEQEFSIDEVVHAHQHAQGSSLVKQTQTNGIDLSPGIYIAAIDTGAYVDFAIANLQNRDLLFSVLKPSGTHMYGLLAAHLNPFNYKIFTRISNGELPESAVWTFHLLSFRTEICEEHQPWTFPFKLKTKHFNQAPTFLPILEKNGWLIPIQKQSTATYSSAQPVTTEEKEISSEKKISLTKPDAVIDLHIEKLRKDHKNLPIHEILPYQLRIFEEKLEAALAYKMAEITFIHGAGSGALKSCIMAIAKDHPQVKKTQAGDLQLYGLGATIVYFK